MKHTKKRQNKMNYVGLIIPTIVLLIVGITVIKEIPHEAWVKSWEGIVAFANTWLGMFVIMILAIPVVATLVLLPVKLFLFLIRLGDKKGGGDK